MFFFIHGNLETFSVFVLFMYEDQERDNYVGS